MRSLLFTVYKFCTVLTVCLFLYIDLNQLKLQYQHPNLDALRAALRYRDRGWVELLNFELTHRYSSKRKTRVTDFLLEPSPEPDLTLLQINLIPLTEEQEMAKLCEPL